MKTPILAVTAAWFTLTGAAQTVLSPGSPALSASPAPVVVPGTSIAVLQPVTTNAVTNLTIRSLSDALTNLQTAVEQTLPRLATFNDSFSFISLGTNAATAATTNFFSSLAELGTNAPALGLSDSNGVPVGLNLPTGGIALPATRDTLRALLVLQNDLERLLSNLDALNGGTNGNLGAGLAPGFAPNGLTNTFPERVAE